MEQINQDELLRNYIERVVALQSERRHALALDDLKGIARELGMTDDDMIAADRAVEAHIERGLRHGAHGRWNDAIIELTDAVALNPANLRGLYGLAIAYKERWMSTGNDDDRARAARLAKQCLQLYPEHDPSYLLLNDLDIRREARTEVPRVRRGLPRWMFALPIVLGIVALVWLFLRPDPGTVEPPPLPISPAETLANPAVAPPPTMEQPAEPGSNLGLLGQGIPVIWLGEQKEGVGLELREVYSEVGATRKLQLLIDNTGEVPLIGLEVEIEDYDMYGLKISANRLKILSEEDSPIAPKTFRTTYLEYPVTGMPRTYKVSIVDARGLMPVEYD